MTDLYTPVVAHLLWSDDRLQNRSAKGGQSMTERTIVPSWKHNHGNHNRWCFATWEQKWKKNMHMCPMCRRPPPWALPQVQSADTTTTARACNQKRSLSFMPQPKILHEEVQGCQNMWHRGLPEETSSIIPLLIWTSMHCWKWGTCRRSGGRSSPWEWCNQCQRNE